MVSTGVDKSNSRASEPIVYSRFQDSSYRYPGGACICTHIYVYVHAGVRVRGLHVRGVRVVCMCAVCGWVACVRCTCGIAKVDTVLGRFYSYKGGLKG